MSSAIENSGQLQKIERRTHFWLFQDLIRHFEITKNACVVRFSLAIQSSQQLNSQEIKRGIQNISNFYFSIKIGRVTELLTLGTPILDLNILINMCFFYFQVQIGCRQRVGVRGVTLREITSKSAEPCCVQIGCRQRVGVRRVILREITSESAEPCWQKTHLVSKNLVQLHFKCYFFQFYLLLQISS